jgi:hypothetical protein
VKVREGKGDPVVCWCVLGELEDAGDVNVDGLTVPQCRIYASIYNFCTREDQLLLITLCYLFYVKLAHLVIVRLLRD